MVHLKEIDRRMSTAGLVVIDNAIASSYLVLGSFLPAPKVLTAAAFTISANARTFTLPTTNNAQYRGEVEIQLVSDGSYLKRMSREEINSFYDGSNSTTGTGRPAWFSLYEGPTQ